MKLGDLVRYLPKEYGTPDHPVKDQWAGLTGMIVNIYRETTRGLAAEFAVLVVHPDDGYPTEILTFDRDVELIGELTDEQLENVIGGQRRETFEAWRAERTNEWNYINRNRSEN